MNYAQYIIIILLQSSENFKIYPLLPEANMALIYKPEYLNTPALRFLILHVLTSITLHELIIACLSLIHI